MANKIDCTEIESNRLFSILSKHVIVKRCKGLHVSILRRELDKFFILSLVQKREVLTKLWE